jgi:hypothetical protein
MATAETQQRVALETERRDRLAVPALAGGVLYLLSGIVINAILKGLPTVGIVQGLEPALRGEADPAVSPRAAEVRFIDHHAFGLIAGSVLTVLAVAALTLVLLFLVDCTRVRRPDAWPPARPLVLIGGVGYAALNLVHQIALAISSHEFANGRDLSNSAVEKALLGSGGLGVTLALLGLLAALALAIGTISVAVGAMRAGLLPRWLSVLGVISGLLFLPFFAAATLQLIPAFWLVATGVLLMGRWPGGDPPAWAAGEARPWPTQAELRAERERAAGNAVDAVAGAAEIAPAPTPDAAEIASAPTPDAGEIASAQAPAAGEIAPPPTPAGAGARRRRRKRR